MPWLVIPRGSHAVADGFHVHDVFTNFVTARELRVFIPADERELRRSGSEELNRRRYRLYLACGAVAAHSAFPVLRIGHQIECGLQFSTCEAGLLPAPFVDAGLTVLCF